MSLQLVESDNEWLKKCESEKRAVKMSLIRQHMPHLISKFEQEQKDKLTKKNKASQNKGAAKVKVGPISSCPFICLIRGSAFFVSYSQNWIAMFR